VPHIYIYRERERERERGRARVRFPIPVPLWPFVYSAFNKYKYQKIFLRVKRDRRSRLTNSHHLWAHCGENVGSSTAHNHIGLHGLLLYVYYIYVHIFIKFVYIRSSTIFSEFKIRAMKGTSAYNSLKVSCLKEFICERKNLMKLKLEMSYMLLLRLCLKTVLRNHYWIASQSVNVLMKRLHTLPCLYLISRSAEQVTSHASVHLKSFATIYIDVCFKRVSLCIVWSKCAQCTHSLGTGQPLSAYFIL
jgi:hypothetical protein